MKSIESLKEAYLDYFKDVPVQKYAAMAIGRDEDTIIRWKNEDTLFADRVNQAKAEFVRKRILAVKAEFALEKLMGDVFKQEPEEHKVSLSLDHLEGQNLVEEFTNFVLGKTSST